MRRLALFPRAFALVLALLLGGAVLTTDTAQAKPKKNDSAEHHDSGDNKGVGEVRNAHPQDNGPDGPVPQERGKDKREKDKRKNDGKGDKDKGDGKGDNDDGDDDDGDDDGDDSDGGGQPAPPAGKDTLVLYDDDGAFGYLGELYAMGAGNLASHFGSWKAQPVSQYLPGKMLDYDAVVYIGSTYKGPLDVLSVAFLDDVLLGLRPVIWMYDNIWTLANRSPAFVTNFGFNPWVFDTSAISEVRYKGQSLTRYAPNPSGILNFSSVDPTKATVLAEAVRPDGTTLPWATRSGNLIYIGENPFAYISENDRYLVFADLLHTVLAPNTPERHRAMVRLEDIGPKADPSELRAIADYLSAEGVPFSFIVFPVYRDPKGALNNGVPEEIKLKDRPELVEALRYMQRKGGTMVLHGYTHQYRDVANPYNGVSGDDFEFYLAHEDPVTNFVVYDGPVPEDSQAWALGRIDSGIREIKAAGLSAPKIWEFPHYAGSAADYRAVAQRYTTRYDRGLYFGGTLTGKPADHTKMIGQFFPYLVKDVYGSLVLPENIGNYEPEAYNNHPARFPSDLIASARRNLVVRDGFASFFYHPYFGLDPLKQTVGGIKALGYTFVGPGNLAADAYAMGSN